MALWGKQEEGGENPTTQDGNDPQAVEADHAADLDQVADTLGKFGRQLDQASEQLMAYLLRREAAASGAKGGTPDFSALAEKIDAIGARLEGLGGGSGSGDMGETPVGEPTISPDMLQAIVGPVAEKLEQLESKLSAVASSGGKPEEVLGPMLGQVHDGINQHHQAIAQTITQTLGQVQQHLDTGMQHLAGQVQQNLSHAVQYMLAELRPPEPEQSDDALGGDWQQALFGPALAQYPGLDAQRNQLLADLLAGNAAAQALIGELLVFRATPVEKMAPLLKEVGEAYYRWQPKRQPGSMPMEDALVAWLKRCCDEAGIGNTIEVVHPGERVDSARHTTLGRGVEITEVLGWIVLRDNGRVYTKATVAVR